MTYVKNVWQPGEAGGTIVSANWLNHSETQFDQAVQYTDDAIAALPPSGGGFERVTLSVPSASGNAEIDAGADSFTMVSMASDAATRVRGYRSTIDRTQDSSRPIGAQPPAQGIVLFEFIFASAGAYWATGFESMLADGGSTLYLAVDGAASIEITIEREVA